LYILRYTGANRAPNPPTNPVPKDGAKNVSITPTLIWSCTDPDGDALTYTLYFGEKRINLQLLADGLIQASYSFKEALEYNKTYYWKVVAIDEHGAKSEGDVWQFTTKIKEAVVYPNPFKPAAGHTHITFGHLTSEATIEIYTLNGECVRVIEERDGDGEVKWAVTNEDGKLLGKRCIHLHHHKSRR
jgi:hypothetical protein